MSKASASQHIDRSYTSLELLGGRDCGDFRVNPDLTVGGGALINKSLCVQGSISTLGDLIAQGNLAVIGNEIVYGDLTVYGNTNITGNLQQVLDLAKVKVSGTDVVLDYLDAKLLAGTAVTLTTIPGISEKLRIDVVESGKVKVTAGDTLDYLGSKLVAGNAITLTTIPGEQIRIDGLTILSGVVTLGALGTAVVLNPNVTSNSNILLTVQDGGAQPTGSVFVLSRVPGTSFTIKSTATIADSGVVVYYQIW
jgi:hypothetical protein